VAAGGRRRVGGWRGHYRDRPVGVTGERAGGEHKGVEQQEVQISMQWSFVTNVKSIAAISCDV